MQESINRHNCCTHVVSLCSADAGDAATQGSTMKLVGNFFIASGAAPLHPITNLLRTQSLCRHPAEPHALRLPKAPTMN